MNILVLGATGYVGSTISDVLRSRGHCVTGVARSRASAVKLRERGIHSVFGDIEAPEGLTNLSRRSDGVVYVVEVRQPHAPDAEPKALFALLRGLEGSGKPFVLGSGAWYYGDTGGRVADESWPANAPAIVAIRPALERLTLDSAERRVRCAIIRPGNMYGKGAGLPSMFTKSVREHGAARYIGDGKNFWPVVHVGDIAKLFVLALERAKPGDIFNGCDETSFTVQKIAEAASWGAGAGGRTESLSLEEARKIYGSLADALAMDQRISSKRARAQLGWTTRMTTILDDLGHGSYTFATKAAARARWS